MSKIDQWPHLLWVIQVERVPFEAIGQGVRFCPHICDDLVNLQRLVAVRLLICDVTRETQSCMVMTEVATTEYVFSMATQSEDIYTNSVDAAQ